MKGYNYLKNRYHISNIYNSYLGIKDLKVINNINNSDNLKIVSCSLMVEVKRIDMIMRYLSTFAKEMNIKIEWHHIGDGLLKDNLIKQKEEVQNEFLNIVFVGYLENRDVYKYYMKNSFDYLITLSASEGLPVTLMEASSIKLPIIATDVGGINEIITDGLNGFLLSENPSYDEFRNKLIKVIEYKNNSGYYLNLQDQSRKIFLEKFEANKNYMKFVEFLKGLL
jgi:glycosyltransferase involved in cell wall biosynthesis